MPREYIQQYLSIVCLEEIVTQEGLFPNVHTSNNLESYDTHPKWAQEGATQCPGQNNTQHAWGKSRFPLVVSKSFVKVKLQKYTNTARDDVSITPHNSAIQTPRTWANVSLEEKQEAIEQVLGKVNLELEHDTQSQFASYFIQRRF